jgi:DNA replication protein DnaC
MPATAAVLPPTDCLCTAGLVNPPALPGKLSLVEERSQQYQAGLLSFCDCDLGQRAQRFYADRSANPDGKQQAERSRQRRIAYLESIDGMQPHERTMTLATYKRGPHNRQAIDIVAAGVKQGHGLVTVHGAYGVGKTALLMAAVNECRQHDMVAIYTTVADLLQWLRNAFDPKAERDPEDRSFERRWSLLVSARCLALDELTAFSVTPWAAEKFERLIDERWRAMGQVLTVCAFNPEPDDHGQQIAFPGVIESRLRDRRAAWVEIKGVDMRRVYRGEAER